jgi:hypothetical protein
MIESYVYKITNTVTGEFYYGYRHKNQKLGIPPEEDLWINYFTSSIRIKNDIKKYGANSFVTAIVFRSHDSMECWRTEQQLIKESWGEPLLLNGKYHDTGSMVEIYRRVGIVSDKARAKMSAAGKGRPKSENHKKNIAIANTGKKGSIQKSKKISVARMGKPPSNKGISPPKENCPHCGKLASIANLRKWHGDRCKVIDPQGHLVRITGIANLHNQRN